MVLLSFAMAYYWVVFSRMIDARMSGEMARTDPRVFARPFELHRGQALTAAPAGRPAERSRATRTAPAPSSRGNSRSGATPSCSSRATATTRARPSGSSSAAGRRRARSRRAIEHHRARRPTRRPSSASRSTRRSSRRSSRPRRARSAATCRCRPSRSQMIQAVLAIEDRRFYDHPGIDPIGIAGAVFRNVFGNKAYLRERQHVTQQLVKNTFLTPEQDAEAQDDRMVHVGRARDAAHQGPDSRALPERRLARPARLVRDPRRGRGGAAVLRARTSPTSR